MSPTTDWYKIDVMPTISMRIAMGSWCEDQFGLPWQAVDNRDGRWCFFWAYAGNPWTAIPYGCGAYAYRLQFREQADAVLFALRWS